MFRWLANTLNRDRAPTGTAGRPTNKLICDVILHFCALQELWNNVQDSSPGKSPPAVQLKWFLCDVISLHRWWKRQEILTSCRSNPVFDRGIHQAWLLLGKIKLFICDVIPDYHVITGRRNMKINPFYPEPSACDLLLLLDWPGGSLITSSSHWLLTSVFLFGWDVYLKGSTLA